MKRPSVLIVDDEPRMRKSMTLLLQDDFHVFSASNGEEGLMIFDSRPMELVLLDLNMPVMNGLETLEKIRERCSKTNVMIMTGRSRLDWAKRCADLNVQGYIEKPFESKVLIGRMKRLLGLDDFKVLRKLWGKVYDAKMVLASPGIREALSIVQNNLKRNITRKEVAAHLDITPSYLSRLFKKECGIGMREYINRCRIEKGLEEIERDPKLKVKEVAALAGIHDANYFCRLFKKHTGLTPREFMKKSDSD